MAGISDLAPFIMVALGNEGEEERREREGEDRQSVLRGGTHWVRRTNMPMEVLTTRLVLSGVGTKRDK